MGHSYDVEEARVSDLVDTRVDMKPANSVQRSAHEIDEIGRETSSPVQKGNEAKSFLPVHLGSFERESTQWQAICGEHAEDFTTSGPGYRLRKAPALLNLECTRISGPSSS